MKIITDFIAAARNHSDVALVSSGATYSILQLPWGQIAGMLAVALGVLKLIKFILDWYRGTKE